MSQDLSQELQAMEARINSKLEKIVDILDRIAQNQLAQQQSPGAPGMPSASQVTAQPSIAPSTPATAAIAAPPTSVPGSTELSSARGIDYTALRDYLKQKEWRIADYETYRVMLQAVGRQEGDVLRTSDMAEFPCQDLTTLCRLWSQYTGDQFGFKAQVAVWERTKPNWERFGSEVGWTNNGLWIDHNKVQYHQDAPKGHFPGWGNGPWLVRSATLFPALAERVTACQIV